MRLTWKDGVATVGVAAAVALFLVDLNLPMMSGPRALAGAVFALGIVACALGGSNTMDADSTPPAFWTPVFGTLGTVTLLVGLVAMITGNAAALAVLVVGTVALWLVATARRARARPDRVTDRDLHRLIDQERQAKPR